MTTTIPLEVYDFWIELEGVSNGVLLQKLHGSTLYYLYSDTRPDKDAIGHIEPVQQTPSALFGGRIWVRSKNYSRIAYTPSPVDPVNLLEIIGDITQLPTNDKDSVVDSIIELEQRIDLSESGGYHSYTHTVQQQEVLDKKLTLLHSIIRASIQITVQGGPLQFLDIDFTINPLTPNIVEWGSLALELFLVQGDKVTISYLKA